MKDLIKQEIKRIDEFILGASLEQLKDVDYMTKNLDKFMSNIRTMVHIGWQAGTLNQADMQELQQEAISALEALEKAENALIEQIETAS